MPLEVCISDCVWLIFIAFWFIVCAFIVLLPECYIAIAANMVEMNMISADCTVLVNTVAVTLVGIVVRIAECTVVVDI